MGSLAGKSPASTYKSLLKVVDETNGVSSTLSQIEDGEGTSTCISVGDDNFKVKPQTDNTTTTFEVENASGNNVLTVDTSNSLIKIGTTQTPANSQILEFNARGLVPTSSGTHYFVGRSASLYDSNFRESPNGTGTDPDTSYDGGISTDDYLENLFLVPLATTIDAVKFMVSTSTDTDCIINVHLMSFDITNAGGTDDGNLTNGTLLANGQATAVDRNVIKTVTCSIDSSSVAANKVIACFVENETNTDSVFLQTQVLYHFD